MRPSVGAENNASTSSPGPPPARVSSEELALTQAKEIRACAFDHPEPVGADSGRPDRLGDARERDGDGSATRACFRPAGGDLWNLRLPHHLVDTIERVRANDVSLVVTVEVALLAPRDPWKTVSLGTGPTPSSPKRCSQSRWLSMPRGTGLRAAVGASSCGNLGRPAWTFAKKHLVEAEAALAAHNAKAAIVACRQAWAVAENILVPVLARMAIA